MIKAVIATLLAGVVAVSLGALAAAQSDGGGGLMTDGLMPTGSTVLGELARVVDVVDGDTIKVERGNGSETVRYIGIDTPETVHPDEPVGHLGPEASAANKALVAGKWVILESDQSDTDRYDRLLRYVWVATDEGLLLVNNELVRLGLAESVAYPPDTWYQELFDQTQAEAMANGVGLYATAPTPAPIDRTLKQYDDLVSYRWMDTREYDCPNPLGCVGLLLKPKAACTKQLAVRLALFDADGGSVGSVLKTRKNVKKGQSVKFRVDVTDGAAHSATIDAVRCSQIPEPTPRPTPKPTPTPPPKAAQTTPERTASKPMRVAVPRDFRASVSGASRTIYFDIKGRSPNALMAAAMRGAARYCSWKRAIACVSYKLGPRLQGFISGYTGKCTITKVRWSTPATTAYIPRWTRPDRATRWVVWWWKKVAARVGWHEAQHVRIYKKHRAKLPRLVGMPCVRAKARVDRWAKVLTRAQNRFDRIDYPRGDAASQRWADEAIRRFVP